MTKPIVSVIVPAYNAEKTIDKCLQSLINQTLTKIEIIVINDKSRDNTLKILNKYKDNPKIKIIDNEKNLGPAASRNKGLDIATGKYIGFVDSDDYVDEKMFEEMSSKMTDDIDLVCCGRYNVTKNGMKEIINTSKETDAKAFSKTSNYNCDKLFKKSIIDKYNLRLPEQYSYAEDFAFGIRYKYYANKMYIIEKPFYYYLFDSENSITNSYKKNLLNIIDVLEDMVVFFKENNDFEKYEKELIELSAGFYVRRIREFKKFNDKKLQREFVKKFLNYFKKNFKNYKHQVNLFKSKHYRFYRCSYLLMLLYIEIVGLRRKK